MLDLIRPTLTGNYRPHGDIHDAEFVGVQAFGIGRDGRGEINRQLARQAVDIAEEIGKGRRVMAQKEVALAILDMGAENYLLANIQPETEQEKRYFDSGHVIDRMAAIMGEPQTTVMLTQGYHIARVDRRAQRRFPTVVPEGLPLDFDPGSTQLWTRNKWLWRPYGLASLAIADFELIRNIRR